jgi:uncharacterized protein
MVPGKIVHFEVPADDTDRALGFYGQLFDWSFQDMEGPVEYHMTQVSEETGGAIHRADQGGGIPGIFVYFDVDDINEGAERVRQLGGDAESLAPSRRWAGMRAARTPRATTSDSGKAPAPEGAP